VKGQLEPGRGLSEGSATLADGRELRVVTAGAGGPLVVFEAGGGACASEWTTVQRLVAERCRTLAYDRSGYGGSDDDSGPRTPQAMARDLKDLLHALDEPEPAVFVGHSWGGPVLRAFSQHAPRLVAGLVFVDATVSDLMTRRDARLATAMAALQMGIAKVGLPNPLGRMLAATFGPDVPPEDRVLAIRDFVDKRATVTFWREAQHIAPSLPLLSAWEAAGLPAVPIASVVGATPSRGQAKLRASLIEQQRAEMQRYDGTLVVVDGAGHFVPQQRPTETARAIVDLVDRVQPAGTAT